jgi:hypothetical protein
MVAFVAPWCGVRLELFSTFYIQTYLIKTALPKDGLGI